MDSRWAILICKFKDDATEPYPRSYFERLYTETGVGSKNMVDYFFEVSHGNLNLKSQVFGWLTLDQTVSDRDSVAANEDPRPVMVGWAHARAQQEGIDLSPFYGTVVHVNVPGGEGGTLSSPYGPWAFFSGIGGRPDLIGHEMGHAFSLNHSMEDGNPDSYQDPWDIMSAMNTFQTPHNEYFSVGPILNAWNMRHLEWLDETRVHKLLPRDYRRMLITLRPLLRRDLSGWLAVELPGRYLVEFRMREGWDAGIPRPAILVHRFSGDNRSYIMHGSSGSRDLVQGDTFTAEVGDSEVTLHVSEIDTQSRTATILTHSKQKPPTCETLLENIPALNNWIKALQNSLLNANPSQKSGILKQIAAAEKTLSNTTDQAKAMGCL